MKKYKVIALSVGANSGKVFQAKEIVSANAWDEGRAEELVEQGFLEEYIEEEIVEGKHILTEDDLKGNPELVLEGFKVGDELTLPKEGFNRFQDNKPKKPTTKK